MTIPDTEMFMRSESRFMHNVEWYDKDSEKMLSVISWLRLDRNFASVNSVSDLGEEKLFQNNEHSSY